MDPFLTIVSSLLFRCGSIVSRVIIVHAILFGYRGFGMCCFMLDFLLSDRHNNPAERRYESVSSYILSVNSLAIMSKRFAD